MLGFKSMEGAQATIAGVELWQILRKGQMKNVGAITSSERFHIWTLIV